MKRVFQKRYATGLAAIRHQHGYSQANFAQLLGISKSVLAMAECGRRSLPSAAFFKITDLELERLEKEKAAGQDKPGAPAAATAAEEPEEPAGRQPALLIELNVFIHQ